MFQDFSPSPISWEPRLGGKNLLPSSRGLVFPLYWLFAEATFVLI